MGMKPAELTALSASSSRPVGQGLRRLVKHAAYGRWLGRENRYRTHDLTLLDADYKSNTLRPRNLADYVAASAPLHCCDGWGFLGRALGCQLRGDVDVARHLTYYAELRAAMALLATQGIGVFATKHFAFNAAGVPDKVHGEGTHKAAWELLEAWAGMPSAARTVGDVLMPAGRTMHDWIESLPSGATWQPIATDWLRALGVDLKVFSDDRDARNEASYRPNFLRVRDRLPSGEALEAASALWRLLEPSPPFAFAEVDRYLLRKTLETAFRSTSGRTARQAPAMFRRQVEGSVSAGVESREQELWIRFLLRVDDPGEPPLLAVAELPARSSRSDYHLSMMGRALLLLRVASGATRLALKEAGVGLAQLSFWWSSYGERVGLWGPPAPAVSELTNGWADIAATLQDVDAYLEQAGTTYRGVVVDLPQSLATLGGLDLVGVWGLAA